MGAVRDFLLRYTLPRYVIRQMIPAWKQRGRLRARRRRTTRPLAAAVRRFGRWRSRRLQAIYRSAPLKAMLSRDGALARLLLKGVHGFARRSEHEPLLRLVADVYRVRRHLPGVFETHFQLFRIRMLVGDCVRAMSLEKQLGEQRLYRYYRARRAELPLKVALVMDCAYAQDFDEVHVDWAAVRGVIREALLVPLALNALLAALVRNEPAFVEWMESEVFAQAPRANRQHAKRILQSVAVCYYRWGRLCELRALGARVSYPEARWQFYQAFANANPVKAMKLRGEMIREAFMRRYPGTTSRAARRVLVPEKDLAAEVFNAFVYDSIADAEGRFTVVCDARLHKVLCNNFPSVDFVPKTPRYLRSKRRADFDKLPIGLDDYLDNHAYATTTGGEFFSIDFPAHFDTEVCRANRVSGWLKPDPALVRHWRERLKRRSGRTLVGFSAHSTLRSGLRDLHMVSLDHWEGVFSLPGCVFVNLNPSFSADDCAALALRFGAEVVQPDFDLYNDFDNLLALLAVLDYGVVPPNNLMDFAAAVGLRSVVFSPSSIMRSWVLGNDDAYVFSERVRFVFPETPREAAAALVSRGAGWVATGL